MELAGAIVQNLEAAVKSAERLRGHPAHVDTVAYWKQLLARARATIRSLPIDDPGVSERLMSQLQSDLAEREQV